MFRLSLLSLFAVIMFSGCALHPKPAQEDLYIDENTLVLFALDAQSHNDFAQAVGYYDLLYKKTKDELYRQQAMNALMQGRYFNDIVSRVTLMRQNGEAVTEQDRRYLVIALLSQQNVVEAKKEALELTKASPNEENYLILTDVYLLEKDYDKTLETLEKAYALNYSEQVLDKISLLMYSNLNRQNEAIQRIEQHVEHFGYSPLLTKRLVAFYGDQRDEEGLLRTYPHLYELEPTDQNADMMIQLYWNAKQETELRRFLEETGSNDELLLKIYIGEKNYPKAIALAERLYDETGEIDYLGQKAIFTYEAAKNKNDKKLLENVIRDLKTVVAVKEEGYYLNYLGYCMIEYDIDVEGGMAYVNRALAIEPESPYVLDSLAWGYYKQGNCQKADELMKRVVKLMGSDDKEVKAHLKAIRKCIKGKK